MTQLEIFQEIADAVNAAAGSKNPKWNALLWYKARGNLLRVARDNMGAAQKLPLL